MAMLAMRHHPSAPRQDKYKVGITICDRWRAAPSECRRQRRRRGARPTRQVVGHAFRVHALDAVQRVARGRHRLDRAAKAPADEDLERLRLFLLGRLILRLFAFLLRRLFRLRLRGVADGFTASLGGLTGRRRVSRNARAGTRPSGCVAYATTENPLMIFSAMPVPFVSYGAVAPRHAAVTTTTADAAETSSRRWHRGPILPAPIKRR